jgi:hypothetical protein
MTWDLRDTTSIEIIGKGAQPPSDITGILINQAWNHVFSVWADDKAQTTDCPANVWYEFWTDCNDASDLDELDAKYFAASRPVQLPDCQSIQGVWRDRGRKINEDDDDDRVIDDKVIRVHLRGIATQELAAYVNDFSQDVKDAATAASEAVEEAKIQGATPSQPTKLALTRERIDQAYVDAVNVDALKQLTPDTKDKVGSGPISFWMLDADAGSKEVDLLLIGKNHRQEYVEFARDEGATQGKLKMKSKGGAFSTGEILVQRVTGVDEGKLQAAIKRFSEKKVTFVDIIPDVI